MLGKRKPGKPKVHRIAYNYYILKISQAEYSLAEYLAGCMTRTLATQLSHDNTNQTTLNGPAVINLPLS